MQERADLNRKIEQLRSRIESNVLVQEGEKPGEDPSKLIAEIDTSLKRLEYLITRINMTNCRISEDGVTLTEMIAKKDTLRIRAAAYRDIVSSAGQMIYRARNTEIKIIPAIDVAKVQKKADEISKEIRTLDNRIQQLNWTADLIEDYSPWKGRTGGEYRPNYVQGPEGRSIQTAQPRQRIHASLIDNSASP